MEKCLDPKDFRSIDQQFILAEGISDREKTILSSAGYPMRADDNAMLLYGYIDPEAGLSYELFCAAYVYGDGAVTLEPARSEISFKLRYGSFEGRLSRFEGELPASFLERASLIQKAYAPSEELALVRSMRGLDHLRAPGFPDDLAVFTVREGLESERNWGRVVGADRVKGRIAVRLLCEPFKDFGVHEGDVLMAGLLEEEGRYYAAVLL